MDFPPVTTCFHCHKEIGYDKEDFLTWIEHKLVENKLYPYFHRKCVNLFFGDAVATTIDIGEGGKFLPNGMFEVYINGMCFITAYERHLRMYSY